MKINNKNLKLIFRHYKKKILVKLGVLQLDNIFISPSHECNANCIHCYEKFPSKKKASLSTYEVKSVIDQFYNLGGMIVFFCSGEFLLRKDAIELISYVSKKNMLARITSNGLLIDEKKIEELKKAGLNKLIISIDSADPDKHDEYRNYKGCFEKAIHAIKMAKQNGIRTQIWTYVTKTNYSELDGISALAKESCTDPAFVFFPLLSGNLFNKPEENLSFEDREFFRNKFNDNQYIQLEFPFEHSLCRGGGMEHINVMPTGDITFCPPVPYSYGNIKNRTLKECLKYVVKDYQRFKNIACKGQCPVNFNEYRNNCNAKFIYKN